MADAEHTKVLAHELANRSLAQIIVETGILVLIALTALVGNSCVLYVFYKTPSFRSVTNYYIITLAISDVVFALVAMPPTISVSAYGRDVVGNMFGHFLAFFGLLLIYGSLLTATLIAVNRYVCVTKPSLYRKYFKPKPAIFMIIGVWFISLFFVTVVAVSANKQFQFFPGRFVYFFHSDDNSKNLVVAWLGCCLFVIYPTIITANCYWKLYKFIKEHKASTSRTLNAAGPAGNSSSLSKEDVHITKSVLALVCGFVLCWIPSSTVIILSLYVNLPRSAEMVMTYTTYASSAINPFVFNLFNKPFRKRSWKVLRLLSQVKRSRVGAAKEPSPTQ